MSTVKAANPINLYGATKLCSDKLFVAGNSYTRDGKTRFSVVRYGNVMGSRGSVIPLFKQQREAGVVTLTDERMTRFWLSIEQGVQFVLDRMADMYGGEIFVPKIPSMKLTDLAEAIAPACRWETVGIRPGEKLHEVMITEDDSRHTLEYPDFYIIRPEFSWWGSGKWEQGIPVKEGFSYSSETNDRWLSVEELRAMTECRK